MAKVEVNLLDEMGPVGNAVDRLDNLIAASQIPGIPDKMKLDCTLSSLREIAQELKGVYVKLAGENPWE